ncbi:MAG: hypothetical protein GX267_01635 [Fibrobacter sp.]|nr:hypothetical protein [Fibrobacter sp.]
MRKMLFFCCFFPAVLVFTCTEFPTSFNRVDSDVVRLLDFIYEPAEASPGDTVELKAVFSGKDFDPSTVSWSFSTNVVANKYGSDTAFNIRPLDAVPRQDYFSDNTICISFKFEVPQDIFKTSGQIPDNWIELLPPEVLKSLPPDISGLNKDQLIDMVNLLTQSPQMYNTIAAGLEVPIETLSSIMPLFSQLFTTRMRFFADIRNEINIKSSYSVRYHTRFSKIPQIPIFLNHNPRIDSMGIYMVKGEKDSYDPSEKIHQFIRIDIGNELTNIVPVQDDYSYFLVAFHNHPDTFQSLFDLTGSSGSLHLEKLTTIWFFRHNDQETRDIPSNRFMKATERATHRYEINSAIDYYSLQSVSKMEPPTDKSIKTTNVWCQIYDDTDNEMFHPVGSTLMEGSFTFQY